MDDRKRRLASRTVVASLVLLLALSITTLALAAPAFNTFIIDSTGRVGEYTSLELNSSGNAVISYYDRTNQDLKLAFCNDAVDCDSPTLVTVDGEIDIWTYTSTSLALDSSDRPIISYYDHTNQDLKLAFCNDAVDCDSPTITTVDSEGDVGSFISMALDSSGQPIISYWDTTNGNLKLAFCNDVMDCDSPTLTTVGSGGGMGLSMALDSSDRPIISYLDGDNMDLMLAICNDAVDCDSPTITTVDSEGDVGIHSSVAVDSSGRPVISYADWTSTAPALKVAFCNDAVDCDSPTIASMEEAGLPPVYISLALDSNGLANIGFVDPASDNLRLAVCNDAVDCDSPTLFTVDGYYVGGYVSLEIDSSDNPVISYYDDYEDDLKLALLQSADPEIDVQGNGVSIADGDTTPSTTDDTEFGPVDIVNGTPVTHTFTIRNTGDAALTFGPYSVQTYAVVPSGSSASFSVSAQPAGSVAPGASTTFDVTFSPSSVGAQAAEIFIFKNDSRENPYIFNVQGTGTAPEIDVQGNDVSIPNGDTTPSTDDDTDFGSVEVTSGSIVRTFTIENTGTGLLSLGADAVSLSGTNAADFSVTAQPAQSVDAGSSTTFEITFDPSAAGTRTVEVSIANDDADENPYTFAIQGVGTELLTPEIDVLGNDASIPDGDTTPSTDDYTDFGSVDVASGTITRTCTIENTGNGLLTLGTDAVSLNGANAADFSVTAQPAETVDAGSSTTFEITFDPSAAGTRTAEVSITNDDSDESPYTFTIQGTGTESPPAPEFDDVPDGYWAADYIEALAAAGITSGCGGDNYCPEEIVNRAQMAVFLVRAKHGTSFTPPDATGMFDDVPTDHWAAAWIEQLANDGVTSGCGGGNYCPDGQATRAQMAVFLEIAKRGDGFTPPAATGMFDDVPTDHWAAAWIEQLATDGITSGCGGGNFCPEGQVTRAQMAVFLVKTFNLPMP